MKCSMKMRVLSKENSCPICKTELDKVMISDKLLPFSSLTNTGLFKKLDNKYQEAAYFFTSERLEDIFYEVLAPKCPI